MPLGYNAHIKYAAKQPSSKIFDLIIKGNACKVKYPTRNAEIKEPQYVESCLF